MPLRQEMPCAHIPLTLLSDLLPPPEMHAINSLVEERLFLRQPQPFFHLWQPLRQCLPLSIHGAQCFSALCRHECLTIEKQPHWACHMVLLLIPLNSLACSLLCWPFTTHPSSLMPHSIQGWVVGDTLPALFIYLLLQSKKSPNLACWWLAACDWVQWDHERVWRQRAKLKSPINAFLFEAAKVSQWKGLSLFSLWQLCASGSDLSWMRVSLAGGSSYSCGGWKRAVLCTPSCNSTNCSDKYSNPENDARV